MRRIFIAIEISEEAWRAADGHIDTLRLEYPYLRVGWERPEKLHLTIKFLGDIDEGQLVSLNEAVRRTASRVATAALRIGGRGIFPPGNRARVLWLGVEDIGGEFRRMYATLETECERHGFNTETRDFKPHLTIARLREPQQSAQLVQTHLQTYFEPVEFEVREIVIYESRLQPTGSIYSLVERYRLS